MGHKTLEAAVAAKPKKGRTMVTVRGFVRGALQDSDGTVHMGDWEENVITNTGFSKYIVANVGRTADSTCNAAYVALASGSSNYTTDTTGLASEIAGARATVAPSVVSSKTLQMVATWASNIVSPGASVPIAGCGVFNVSSISSGTAGSLVAFTQSTLSSTQTFSLTYNWVFA